MQKKELIAERLEAVKNAMRYTGEKEEAEKNHERAEIYLIKDETPEELKDILKKIIWDERIGGEEDLSYEIVARACDLVADSWEEDEDGTNDDMYYESESASVYTATRLDYLNAWNQEEISQKQKEFDCDIQQACAVWYDDMVRGVALRLRDYIIKEND